MHLLRDKSGGDRPRRGPLPVEQLLVLGTGAAARSPPILGRLRVDDGRVVVVVSYSICVDVEAVHAVAELARQLHERERCGMRWRLVF